MDREDRRRAVIWCSVIAAALVMAIVTMPTTMSPVGIDIVHSPSSHAPKTAANRAGGNNPHAPGPDAPTLDTEPAGALATGPRPRAEARARFRLLAPELVIDHLLRPTAHHVVAPDGRPLAWVPRAVSPGDVDAAIVIGRTRGKSTQLLLGDFVTAVVVHPANRTRELSRGQLRGLLDGITRDWHRIDRREAPVRVHGLARGTSFDAAVRRRLGVSATPDVDCREHATFERVARHVAVDPGAIAVLPLEVARRHELPMLKIDGFGPPAAGEPASLAYALNFPIVLVTDEEPGSGVVVLARRLQQAMDLSTVERSWTVRSSPRRPGLKVGR